MPAVKKAATNGVGTESGPIVLKQVKKSTVDVYINGVTPLIMSRFSEKARAEISAKQQQLTRLKKEARNPEAEFMAAQHRLADGRHGIHSSAFKNAIVAAARQFEGLTMVSLKVAIYVHGELDKDGQDLLVPILGFTNDNMPVMREDPVRLATGVADLRYRPMYHPWRCKLTITFNESMLTAESLVNLINTAGDGGVGEWRPSAPKNNGGSYGMFTVDTSAQ